MLSDLLARELNDQAATERLGAALDAAAADGGDVRPLAELVHGYLASLPAALDALVAMTKERGHGRGAAFAAGQVLLYLFDEQDLLDDRELGALGLLDDAYLVHGCVAALRAALPTDAGAGYAVPDEQTRSAVRALLPAGVPEALERTCDDLVRVALTLYAGGGDAGAGEAAPRPALRVGEALAGLQR
jgi:hypothetical protein